MRSLFVAFREKGFVINSNLMDLGERIKAIVLVDFLSWRIGFVLTVSATWQIAKSFGKKHPHSSLIQIFGQKNRRANTKTLQAEHFVYFCVHVYANHS